MNTCFFTSLKALFLLHLQSADLHSVWFTAAIKCKTRSLGWDTLLQPLWWSQISHYIPDTRGMFLESLQQLTHNSHMGVKWENTQDVITHHSCTWLSCLYLAIKPTDWVSGCRYVYCLCLLFFCYGQFHGNGIMLRLLFFIFKCIPNVYLFKVLQTI